MAATRTTRTLLSLAMIVAGVTWLATAAIRAGHDDRGLIGIVTEEVKIEIADEMSGPDRNGGVDYSGPLDESGSGYSGPLDESGSGYAGPLDD